MTNVTPDDPADNSRLSIEHVIADIWLKVCVWRLA